MVKVILSCHHRFLEKKLIPVIEKNLVNSCESFFNCKLKVLNYKSRYLLKNVRYEINNFAHFNFGIVNGIVSSGEIAESWFLSSTRYGSRSSWFGHNGCLQSKFWWSQGKGGSAFDSEIGGYGQEFGREFVSESVSVM